MCTCVRTYCYEENQWAMDHCFGRLLQWFKFTLLVGGQLPEQLNFTWKWKRLNMVFEMLSICLFNLITKFDVFEYEISD